MSLFEQQLSKPELPNRPRPQMEAQGSTLVGDAINIVGTEAQNIAKGSIFAKAEGELTKQEEDTLKRVQGEVSSLDNGMAQGAISQTEYKIKRDRILKGYINAFPGLAPEFRQIETNTRNMGLSSAFAEQAKMQAAKLEETKQMAKGVEDRMASYGLKNLIDPTWTYQQKIAYFKSPKVQQALNFVAKNEEDIAVMRQNRIYSKPQAEQAVRFLDETTPNRVNDVLMNGIRNSYMLAEDQKAEIMRKLSAGGHIFESLQNLTPEEMKFLQPVLKSVLDQDFAKTFESLRSNKFGSLGFDETYWKSLTQSTRDFYDEIANSTDLKKTAEDLNNALAIRSGQNLQVALADPFMGPTLNYAMALGKIPGFQWGTDLFGVVFGPGQEEIKSYWEKTYVSPPRGKEFRPFTDGKRFVEGISKNDVNNPATIATNQVNKIAGAVAQLPTYANMDIVMHKTFVEDHADVITGWAADSGDADMPIQAIHNTYSAAQKSIDTIEQVAPEKANQVRESLSSSYTNTVDRIMDGIERHFDPTKFDLIMPSSANNYQFGFKDAEGITNIYNRRDKKALRHIAKELNHMIATEAKVQGVSVEDAAAVIIPKISIGWDRIYQEPTKADNVRAYGRNRLQNNKIFDFGNSLREIAAWMTSDEQISGELFGEAPAQVSPEGEAAPLQLTPQMQQALANLKKNLGMDSEIAAAVNVIEEKLKMASQLPPESSSMNVPEGERSTMTEALKASEGQTMSMGSPDMSKAPRGIRNNNPGNIELGKDKWEGLSKEQTDGRFAQFDSPEYGVRAIGKILNTYSKRGEDTIEEIVSKWAPPNENDTEAYIKAVESISGIGRKEIINTDIELMGVIKGIIAQENGQEWVPEDSVIRKGIALIGKK